MVNGRSPREVFQHHTEALGAEKLEGIVADYSDDAIFITPEGVLRGKDGIRQAFTKLLADVPQAKWDLPTQIYEEGHPAARVVCRLGVHSRGRRDRHVRVSRRADQGPDRQVHAPTQGLAAGQGTGSSNEPSAWPECGGRVVQSEIVSEPVILTMARPTKRSSRVVAVSILRLNPEGCTVVKMPVGYKNLGSGA
jgi:hypothetical protein